MNMNELGSYVRSAWKSARIVFLLAGLAACTPVSPAQTQESTQMPTPIVTPSESSEEMLQYPDTLFLKACTKGGQSKGCESNSDPIPGLIVSFLLVNDEGVITDTLYETTDATGAFKYDADDPITDMYVSDIIYSNGNATTSDCFSYYIHPDENFFYVDLFSEACYLQANSVISLSN